MAFLIRLTRILKSNSDNPLVLKTNSPASGISKPEAPRIRFPIFSARRERSSAL